ncbi:unnamed protein product [Ectocarpus sp. 6 AP-2014]
MEARPPVPLRLSVEERVEHAVSSAVRRALAEQRKTQEEELDSLSDVLQRSLAALAGERDRALRSLAAEEDRRRDMIEELTSLLGGELSCGDVSRLAMGLERIEREAGPAAASEEEGGGGQERGRAWVLERVEQLEALALEARRGEGKKRAAAVALAGVGEGGGAGESVESAEPADGLDGGGGGGGGGDGAVEGVGGAGASASSDGSWSFPSCSQEGAADRAEEEAGRPAAGSVEPGGDGGGPCAAEATAERGGTVAAATRLADEAAADKQAQEPRGGATAGRTASSGGGGDDGGPLLPVKTDHASDGGEGTSGRLAAAPGGGDAQPPAASSEPGEVERLRMAARRSEASLADLRETLGSVLALSFMCGEESARHRGKEEETGGVRLPTEGGGDKEAGCGDPDSVLGVVATLERVGDAAAAAAAESSVSEETVEGTGGTSVGTSRGRERFSPGEAKAAAVDVLLKRLEALSVDQGGDIARLETSLQALRGSSATPTAATAGAAGVSSLGDSGRGDLGGSAREESAQAAAGLKAEDVSDPKLHSPAAAAAAVAPIGEGDQEGGVSKGEAGQGGRGSRDASPKRDIRTEWEELDGLDTHLGHYQGGGGLGSQAVQGVLDRWIDVSKRNILEGWLGHVLHGGPVDSANGSFVPRVQMSSLSKEVRDGMVSVVLPLLLGRRGVLLQVLTRERVELVHDVQIRVTPVAGRRDAPPSSRTSLGGGGGSRWRPAPPVGEREHGARIRDMVMKAAHVGYVEEDEGGGGGGGDGDGQAAWRTPLASVDSLSRQLKDTWETFNANFATMAGESRGDGGAAGGGWAGDSRGGGPRMLPEY